MGTNLVDYCLSARHEVINLDIAPPRNPQHRPYWRQVDILDGEALISETAGFRPSYIVNLAAQTDTSDARKSLEYYAANTRGLGNIVAAAKKTPGVRRLISASSMLVCRPGYLPQNDVDYCPTTLYGESKVLGEQLLRQAEGLPYSWVIVRPTGIWGPWFDAPYRNLFRMIERGLYVHPGRDSVTQSLGFVGNTSCQLDRLLSAPVDEVHGRTFYLADDPPLNMRAWTALIQQAFGAPKIREVPVWLLRTAARAGDGLKVLGWKVPPLTTSRLNNMLTGYVFHLDPLITEGLPYPLEEAVTITVGWMRENSSHMERPPGPNVRAEGDS